MLRPGGTFKRAQSCLFSLLVPVLELVHSIRHTLTTQQVALSSSLTLTHTHGSLVLKWTEVGKETGSILFLCAFFFLSIRV